MGFFFSNSLMKLPPALFKHILCSGGICETIVFFYCFLFIAYKNHVIDKGFSETHILVLCQDF